MEQETTNPTELAILNAAEELFLSKGYSLVSTTAIARKAGCSQAMVHYYYRSKENLFSLVFRRKIAPVLASMIEIKYEAISFEERLRERIRNHFELLRNNERMPLIMLNEVVSNRTLAAKMLETLRDLPIPLIQQLQQELDDEFSAGRIRKTEATDLLFLIMSLNLTSVLIKPVLRLYLNISDQMWERLMDARLKENVDTVFRSLRP
jgi:AcrR family transcriptional regulator